MYTIDAIPMQDYGLIISEQQGVPELPGLKDQFFSVHGQAGYQLVKHKGQVLKVTGYIVATDSAALIANITALNDVFKAPGIRTLVLDNDSQSVDCFSKDGASIDRVHILQNGAFARYQINLTILAEYSTAPGNVFSSVFNSVFGSAPEPEPSSGIFTSVFNIKFA